MLEAVILDKGKVSQKLEIKVDNVLHNFTLQFRS